MRFADVTTLGVGGDIDDFVEVETNAELLATVSQAQSTGLPILILGGGSNLLVGDAGFDGRVIAMRTKGIDVRMSETSSGEHGGTARVRVAAGESWDDIVAWSVENGFAGIEALSGIPGSVGAAPIQNIGAYGQEVSSVIIGVDVYDLVAGEIRCIPADELEFAYRDSVFKQGLEAIVLSVDLELADARATRLSQPIAFDQLAGALKVEMGAQVALADVRDAVLELRRSKGMVLDAQDPDTRSAGSFFVNPIVTEHFSRSLPAEAPRFPVGEEAQDRVLEIGAHVPPLAGPGLVKLSAAWLIENAGIPRGFSLPGSRAAVSSKHTLALTNRGGASAEEIAGLARYVRSMVQSQFGILLQPEPVCIGIEL